jgi:ligand-binding SRPBCC domain-containing protein
MRRVFEKRTIIKTTVEQLIAFHEDPGAMPKLAPPPIFVQIHRDDRQSLTEGELEFTLWFGPIPVRWLACHQPGPTEHSFADLMVKGPLEYWHHEHIFEPLSEGVAMIDRVTLTHKKGIPGIITRLVFDGLPLRTLFFYRHLRTKKALTRRK